MGEVGGLLAEPGQFIAEAVVVEPTVGSICSYAGGVGGSSQGGSSGDNGQGLRLAG